MAYEILLHQPSLPGLCPVTEAVHDLAHSSGVEERGAVFTRREVVDFILDLIGYTPNRALYQLTLLEPSFGDGDFLLPAVERLLIARRDALAAGAEAIDLSHCIRAVELHRATFDRTRTKLVDLLVQSGIDVDQADKLAAHWLVQGDYLLVPLPPCFDVVVGNPPYVRQERIPPALLLEYRRRFETLYDRADLYIPFIERSLGLLTAGGQLGFICADRWMKNRYGGPLRELVSRQFHLRAYVDMVDTPAFHSDVIAYPAITVIAKSAPGPTRVYERPAIEAGALRELAKAMNSAEEAGVLELGVRELSAVVVGDQPWVLRSSNQTEIVRRIESEYPTIEEARCKVGIGVATGADKAFIGPFEDLDVEPDSKLPLVTTRDISTGHVVWRGLGVINPFTDDGALVNLAEYPKLRRYLESHRDAIAKRHVAKKAPTNWYRTIDRITPSLARRPKLLIPDIKGAAQVVYEEGRLYPHHNLYFVVSDDWDLRALQAVLLSDLTRLFIATYSTKMRGGFLRFQAQYLRRIRVPRWESVSDAMRKRLALAAERLDISACNEAVAELYALSPAEVAALAAK